MTIVRIVTNYHRLRMDHNCLATLRIDDFDAQDAGAGIELDGRAFPLMSN